MTPEEYMIQHAQEAQLCFGLWVSMIVVGIIFAVVWWIINSMPEKNEGYYYNIRSMGSFEMEQAFDLADYLDEVEDGSMLEKET